MNKRGVYWGNFSNCRGRTCVVRQLIPGKGNMCQIIFDGLGIKYSVPFTEIYFSDHPAGYNQFN